MQNFEWLQIFVILILFLGAIHDIYSHRIPNLIVVFGLISGMMQRYISDRIGGMLAGIIIAIIVVLIFSPLYLLKVLGAGDIKLLAVLSLHLKTDRVVITFLYVFIIGAIYSLIKLLAHRNLIRRMKYLYDYTVGILVSKKLTKYELGEDSEQLIIPMAVPIFLGGVISIGGFI